MPTVVGPLQAQNDLSEIASAGATAQGLARTNLGIPGAAGPYLPLAGGTLTGELITKASAAGSSGLNLPPGIAPTVPANGDVWTTSTGIFVRVAGATVGPLIAAGTDPLASAHIFVGSAGNVATDVAMTGDVSIVNTGSTTVGKINGVTLGSTTASSGNLLIGSGTQWVTNAMSGDVAISNTGSTTVSSLNSGKAVSLASSFTTSGAFALTLTTTGATNVTIPTTGTIFAGHALIGRQVFTSGAATYTPTTGTNLVVVRQCGGGGAGGGSPTATGNVSVGSGGGAGAYAELRITSAFSGVTVTVGAAGTGSLGATGGNGGNTSFGALLVTNGGSGGSTAGPGTGPTSTPAAGGAVPSTGDIKIAGQAGTGKTLSSTVPGAQSGGRGGSTPIGSGGTEILAVGDGTAATGYGAGGGGASSSSTQFTGGAGAPGVVIVDEYI